MKEVAEIDEQIANKSAELSVLDKDIDKRQSELEGLTDRKTKILNIDKIPVENVMFSDKVKIKKDDYYTLCNESKKYYARKSNTSVLKAQIKLLEAENASLKDTISEQNEELSELKSIRGQLAINKLKQKISQLEKIIEKLFEFLNKFKLRDKWEQFLAESKKRDRRIER